MFAWLVTVATREVWRLTAAERRVLKLVAEYKTNKQIADELCVSVRTVEAHRAHICNKLDITGRHALLQFALKHKEKF